MRTSVICVNDFPEMTFPSGTPDVIIKKERKRIQREWDAKRMNLNMCIHVHIQEVDWYGGTQ